MPRYGDRFLRSRAEIMRFLENMDQDEGIRLVAKGSKLVFATKTGREYCINICDRKFRPELRGYVPGGNDEWYRSDSVDEIWRRVESMLALPIRAWVY